MALSLGAARLPLHHISIRVPWHDAAWNGTVCRDPAGNASCLILKNIHEGKKNAEEVKIAGRQLHELPEAQLPPCIGEHVNFMSPYPVTRFRAHPYASNGAYSHFAPTPYTHPAYSAGAIPFNWTLRGEVDNHVAAYGIPGYLRDREDRVDELLGFHTAWVQTRDNQLAMLDTFFSAIKPEKSLCFFYAKRTPLSEQTGRVIVGVGRVARVGEPVEYQYRTPGESRAMLWERDIIHTIRPGFSDGFLMPYHAALALQAQNPEIDPERFVAFAPDDAFDAFSYGSELVAHDQAISALLNCATALREAQQAGIPGANWTEVLSWIDARLNELWQMRGPCPGIGSALSAYGIPDGTMLALALSNQLADNEDPWPTVEAAFADPGLLGEEWRPRLSGQLAAGWPKLRDERKALLKLLSRFTITAEQAARFYREDQRKTAGIQVRDRELLENPYLFYERDRVSKDPIAIGTVDRGLFPADVVRLMHPLPTPSLVTDGDDWRRTRALLVSVLEAAAAGGDTVRSRDQVIAAIARLPLSPVCPVGYDLFDLIDDKFDPVVKRVEMADDDPAYQLQRLAEVGALIAKHATRAIRATRHQIAVDWPAVLDGALGGPMTTPDEEEFRARQEKVAALEELAAASFSVMIGPAGTGKTTLLSVLCNQSHIKNKGVLILAPTGKARVQLSQKTPGIPARTIAQFLVARDQYKWETGTYLLSTKPPETGYRTVIIDEASMLTEEELAATLSAFDGAPIDRFILVGDPGQLPPIGAGRPFVDIVQKLRPTDADTAFPSVGPGFVELTINRRTKGAHRADIDLAKWFRGGPIDPGADAIWSAASTTLDSGHLAFVKWANDQDLWEKLLDALITCLPLAGKDDAEGFSRSLGAVSSKGNMYFNLGKAKEIERWQILSPVNGQAHGVNDLNRLIQRTFRSKTMTASQIKFNRKLPKPAGSEQIIYGDKVINLINARRKNCWPDDGAHYVANGEIGSIIGRTAFKPGAKADNLWVEFSSQVGYGYDFYPKEFGEEGQPPLQLAYAITIHKSQGSEFGVTFVILPSPLPMMSRELLYTALTRQQERVIVLHQGELSELRRFTSDEWSETARRQTNLFERPRMIEIGNRYLEDRLIHRTSRNLPVRSKSEVIIADLLDRHGVPFAYEEPRPLANGAVRLPDFTIEDPDSGKKVIWEHLGMLAQPDYQRNWDKKREEYRHAGILPIDDPQPSEWRLVTSEDEANGGIDAAKIDMQIRAVFER